MVSIRTASVPFVGNGTECSRFPSNPCPRFISIRYTRGVAAWRPPCLNILIPILEHPGNKFNWSLTCCRRAHIIIHDKSQALSRTLQNLPRQLQGASVIELQRLLATLNDRLRLMALLAIGTGLRCSELFALKWKDIDFDGKTNQRCAIDRLRTHRHLQDGIISEASPFGRQAGRAALRMAVLRLFTAILRIGYLPVLL